MKFEFTIKEINNVVGLVGNLSYVQAEPIIAAIRAVCDPQLAKQQSERVRVLDVQEKKPANKEK